MTALLVRWRAWRVHRAALCSHCGQYLLFAEAPPVVTRLGRRVHPECFDDAEDDDGPAGAW